VAGAEQLASSSMRVILASASPRRQEALRTLGVTHTVVVSHVEASLPSLSHPTDPSPVAVAKAQDIASRYPDAVILAGDTIVTVDELALGKPESPEDAGRMLRRLRGKRHVVRTALAVASRGDIRVSEVPAPLTMREYSDEEIETYVASGEPLDCAGAYDIHRQGGRLIAHVEGCFSAIVGMPVVEAARLLRGVEVELERDPAVVCTQLYGRRCLAAEPATMFQCIGHLSRPGSST
jgi:septum formation protein